MENIWIILAVLLLCILILGGGSFLAYWLWEKYRTEVFLIPFSVADGAVLQDTSKNPADRVQKYKDMAKAAGYQPVYLEDLRSAGKAGAAWCAFAYFILDDGLSETLTLGFPSAKDKMDGKNCQTLANLGVDFDSSDEAVYYKKFNPQAPKYGILVKGKKPEPEKVLSLPWWLPNQSSLADWLNQATRSDLVKKKDTYQWSRYSKPVKTK